MVEVSLTAATSFAPKQRCAGVFTLPFRLLTACLRRLSKPIRPTKLVPGGSSALSPRSAHSLRNVVTQILTLPQRLLQEPVVSCALGKLYNKDAILEYLLDKSSYGDGEVICGHIRSLKVSKCTLSLFYIASFTFKLLDG